MPASYRISAYDARPPLRERLAASGLSLAIIGALVLALLWATTAQFVDMGDRGNPLTTFDVNAPDAPKSPTNARAQPQEPQPKRDTPPPPPPPPPAKSTPQPPTPPLPLPVPVPRPPDMIVLSRDDFAASDIGRIKSRAAPASEGQASASASGGGKPVYGPSDAPGGRTLYAADWYREPTRAEMAPYMPATATEGWGVIACQTAERYRVENCRELGQSPGSGIARGMRQAAWQFLVIPPSIDGKPQIGTWVRIRYDIIRGVVK